MSGPIPKSRKLRILDGNPGKRPAPTLKPAKTAGAPTPPKSMKGAALAEWRRVVPLLEAEGLLSRLDRSLLASYCYAWARLLEAQAAIADGRPMVSDGSHGGRQPRPEIRIARDATAALCRLAGDLGLSPAARARLGGKRDEERLSASWLPAEIRGDGKGTA